MNLGPLEEQSVLLTAEPSLQPDSTLLIPILRRQRQTVSEFKTSLFYRVSSRTARPTQRKPVLKNKRRV